jgi:hypothetical protein
VASRRPGSVSRLLVPEVVRGRTRGLRLLGIDSYSSTTGAMALYLHGHLALVARCFADIPQGVMYGYSIFVYWCTLLTSLTHVIKW